MKNLVKEPFEVHIDDLAVGGKGVGRINGKVVFVQKGIPGQKVEAVPFKTKKDFIEARVLSVLSNSDIQVQPRCSYFSVCGGCSIQNMQYMDQLVYKKKWIKESLERIGGVTGVTIHDTIPSPDIFYYRNKMEFTFSSKSWNEEEKNILPESTGLGLNLPGRFDTVINIKECYLQSEESVKIVNAVREFAVESKLPAYDMRKNRGFWRFLTIRESKSRGQQLVNLITNACKEDEISLIDRLGRQLNADFPHITSFQHAVYSGKSHAALQDDSRVLFGEKFIKEKIGGYEFEIEPSTFFQTNSKQAENLYAEVLKAGDFKKDDVVYDLYTGIGTIPLFLSSHVSTVLGLEIVEASVKSAIKNARRNKVNNCFFLAGKVRVLLKYPQSLFEKYGKPNVIVVDPPRNGLEPKTVQRMININPERIVYVSCNPSTLARDLKILKENYTVDYVVPVDMFPHTAHIESVARLVRK